MASDESIEDLLPEIDREFLANKKYKFSIKRVDPDVHLVLHEFEMPAAYLPGTVDLLIILRSGYPNTGPDMFFTAPDVARAAGGPPNNCSSATHDGRQWQQWSRHIQNRWRPGTDDLRSYITCIRREISKGI